MIIGAALLMLGATSCKKKGKCTCSIFGLEVSEEYTDMDKETYDKNKKDCTDLGCTWSDKL